MADHHHDHRDVDTNRIEALGDGIFAISMTLLVLELRAPTGAFTSAALAKELLQLAPSILSFVISFIVLGIFWIGHRLMFHFIVASNRTHLWINILFYMSISIFPFSAALLGRYPGTQTAVVIYSLNLIICSLLLYANWRYATEHRQLTEEPMPVSLRRLSRVYLLVSPICYALAIALSFWSTRASIAIFVIVPIFYAFPNKIDSYLPHHKE